MASDAIREGLARRDSIGIVGARQNNLRGIDLEIPRRALTVVTGVSGSGKSSLAMATIYAEGQRRYLDGVSAHARRFLERLPRPDVDLVEGISPAVALQQRTAARGARSTVGTSTEVYDFLRLLFARIGHVVCPNCEQDVPRWTVEGVVEAWASGPPRRLHLTFPHAVARDAEAARRALRARGYSRVLVESAPVDLAEAHASAVWDVVQDRVLSDRRGRLAEALEAAFREGAGAAGVHPEGDSPVRYRLGRVCTGCGTAYPEPEPLHFSFNSPTGACPRCAGYGFTLEFDPRKIVPDALRSIDQGAIVPWAGRWRTHFLRKVESSPRARGIPRDRPWRDLDPADREFLMHGDHAFSGVLQFLGRLSAKSYKPGARFLVKRYQSPILCTECSGGRLSPQGRWVRVEGESLPQWCARPVQALRERLRGLTLTPRERETARLLIGDIDHRLDVLERVGLGYLTLDRLNRTLSGGEAQRIELAQALGARLVDALYVLDEPTVGLHPRDTGRLMEVLRDLIRHGNTVIVVEHDREVMLASDWMVDLGPGGGKDGGGLIYCGPTTARLQGAWSPTVEVLRDEAPATRAPLAEPKGWLRLREARRHNLKGVDVDLPWGTLTGVCGVSGSGKSSLVTDTLLPLLESRARLHGPPARLSRGGAARPGGNGMTGDETSEGGLGRLVVEAPLTGFSVVDQDPLPRSARSIPASYVGAWNGIRTLFAALPEARRRGLGPGAFSFNVPGGRCEVCRGEGEVMLDMDFMPDVRLPCEACGGSRFGAEIREVRFRGFDIVEILGLTVDRAVAIFAATPSVTRPLWWMQRVGLGYLTLGQPASTLSGGEAQRLKLTRELAAESSGRLFILDEPTVGLHGAEVHKLIAVLRTLAESGNSVLVVEHHLDVLAASDWLIELGPEGGEAGGELLAQGPPETVARAARSRVAPYLAPRLQRGRGRKVSG
jgi:excinuclease ABC subunit A